MSINERIRQLRRALNLSQAKFAGAIPISSGYIAGIELGRRRANERIIKLICATYGASSYWLKTGDGEMFEHAPDDKLNKVIRLFKQLPPEFQDYVLQQMEKLLEVHSKTDS